MLLGLLAGMSLSIFLASLGLIILGISGLIGDVIVTGAVIGTRGVVSYAVIALVVSFITTVLLLKSLLRVNR